MPDSEGSSTNPLDLIKGIIESFKTESVAIRTEGTLIRGALDVTTAELKAYRKMFVVFMAIFTLIVIIIGGIFYYSTTQNDKTIKAEVREEFAKRAVNRDQQFCTLVVEIDPTSTDPMLKTMFDELNCEKYFIRS